MNSIYIGMMLDPADTKTKENASAFSERFRCNLLNKTKQFVLQTLKIYLTVDFPYIFTSYPIYHKSIYNSMFCIAKLPFLFAIIFYLFTGNDNFREERREKSEKIIVQKETTTFFKENCRFFLVTHRRFELRTP